MNRFAAARKSRTALRAAAKSHIPKRCSIAQFSPIILALPVGPLAKRDGAGISMRC